METKEPINNYLLYYTKYYPYEEKTNNDNNNFESIDINDDENDNNGYTLSGRWSQKEHFLFIKGCLIYGNFWKKVKKFIKTRTCSQIRSHAQKYLYKLNKKYLGNENHRDINIIFNKKLSEEEKTNLANKNKFNEKDMEEAEIFILNLFRGKDKFKYKEQNFEEEKVDKYKFSKKINIKKIASKEKIFNIKKKVKDEKEGISKKKIKDKSEDKRISSSNDKENVIEYMNNINDYESKNNYNENKKISREDILANKDDINLISQKEEFINKCLDSKDPKDLVKLLTYFGNDINFEVNDLNVLKKYHCYLGLNFQDEEKMLE